MLALDFLGVAFDWAMHVGVEVTRIGPAGAFERICSAAHIRSAASAPSQARLCQSGAGPDPGSLGQIPGTACCVVEGNDNGEAYTGR